MEATPFPVVHVGGDARTRGVQYGEQAAEQIARSVAFYADVVSPAAGLDWNGILEGVDRHRPVWTEQDPEIVTEIEGIAAGAGREVAEVLALNTRGTIVPIDTVGDGEEAAPEEGCTSFAVLPEASDNGHMLAGQNWDYLEGIQDAIVLVHVKPSHGPTLLMIVEAGQVGRHGASDAGISLHANGLTGRLRDNRGLPSPFWRRQILREENISKAVEAALRPPKVGSTNLMISHRDGFAINIESQPNTARWLYPEDGWMVHSNHYLGEVPVELTDTYTPSGDSLVRYGRARRHFELVRKQRGIGFSDIAAMLRDHFGDGLGICTHSDPEAAAHERWQTVATAITDLTDGVMWVAAGPPCRHEFTPMDIATGRVRARSHSGGGR